MKFAFVLFKYFPFGGMQRNMMSIANACVESGHTVEVICSEWNTSFPQHIKVTRLGVVDTKSSKNNGAQMEIFQRALEEYRKIHQYDLVIGFNKFLGLDVYYAADSCFATKAFEERSWLYRLTKRSKIYLTFEKSVFERNSKTLILEVSNRERPQFIKYYQTQSSRFITLPPGISKNRVAVANYQTARQEKRKELGVEENRLIFLAVGSGFRTKGLERSIQLLADYNLENKEPLPAMLLVAGQDKENKFLSLAKKLHVSDQVKFLGGRDDIPDLLQAADLILHPAHKENTGNVLLEAMVAGRPVVATDVCGYAHYITGARMGAVLQSPFSQQQYLNDVKSIVSVDDNEWRQRGEKFSQQDEIYSRPTFVVNQLEHIASTKQWP